MLQPMSLMLSKQNHREGEGTGCTNCSSASKYKRPHKHEDHIKAWRISYSNANNDFSSFVLKPSIYLLSSQGGIALSFVSGLLKSLGGPAIKWHAN